MDSIQYKRAEEIFALAMQEDPTSDRAQFLDNACKNDPSLGPFVEALLKAHAEAGTFLNVPVVELGDPEESPPWLEAEGTEIGPYRICEQIGEGGFGVVYLAEQTEPVRRKVALKIIKPGMDTKQVVTRFEMERQALALMDHPNIARVFDAGSTDTGRPYFVMERVKGIPITEYCNQEKLTTQQRLRLFVEVCHAVQHAHQKSIIHRDIKPSNVLVTLQDNQPVPKVIDFGIAKAIHHRLAKETLVTHAWHLIGTPAYMSPDQMRVKGLDIDTRTDVYSLGVLLYELLTGTTPFDETALRGVSQAEIEHVIVEVEPPKPSSRLNMLIGQGNDSAGRSRGDLTTLSKSIKGDLDWIVMKAMEKDRARRYGTASALAEDIERHMRHEPVLAHAPSMSYRFQKFVRRNRLVVMAGTTVATTIVFGLIVTTVFFFRASAERDAAQVARARADHEANRSQKIADFLQDLVVTTNADEILQHNVDVDQVIATTRDVLGDDHIAVAAALRSRAIQLQSAGDFGAAEDLYRESLRILRDQSGENNINLAITLRALGSLYVAQGNHEAAEDAYREGIAIARKAAGEDSVTLAECLALLAEVLSDEGQHNEAIPLMQESIRIRRKVVPGQHFQIAVASETLAGFLMVASKNKAAQTALDNALSEYRKAVPKGSPLLALMLSKVASYHLEHGNAKTGSPLMFEALDLLRTMPNPPLQAYRNLGGCLHYAFRERKNPVAEIPLLIEALDICRVMNGDPHMTRSAYSRLALYCWDIAKDPNRSQQAYEAALHGAEVFVGYYADAHDLISTTGILKYRLGRYEEALATLARSDAAHSRMYGGVPEDVAFIAMAHYRLGHQDKALVAFERLHEVMMHKNRRELTLPDASRAFLREARSLIKGGKRSTTKSAR